MFFDDVITAEQLAKELGLTKDDAAQLLRIFALKGVTPRQPTEGTRHKGGKMPYRYAINNATLQTLRNLFFSTEALRNLPPEPKEK